MLLNILRICVVVALPVACILWTGHLAGPGAKLLAGKEFSTLCLGQQLLFGGDVVTNCLASDWLWLFRGAAWIALGVALAPVVVFLGAALVCGTSRWLNVAVFPRMIPVAIGMVVLNLLMQGALLLLAFMAFYLTYLGNPPPYVIVIAAVSMMGVAGAVILGATDVSVDPVLPARAMTVSRTEAPALWDLVDQIAETMEATPPDNLILGFDSNFWVVSGRVELTGYNLGGHLRGETLYLSLPLMSVLSMEELIGIIAHELGHFRGRDTQYSARFMPVFHALANARYDLDDYDDILRTRPLIADLLTGASKIPARALLGMLGSAFARNVSRISQRREFEADAAATEVADPAALGRALFKVPLYAAVWDALLEGQAERIDRLRPRAMRLTRHFGDAARVQVTRPVAEDLRQQALRARFAHPYDSHPTTRQRLRSLGLKAEDLTADDLRRLEAERPAELLIPEEELNGIEATLMLAEFVRMQAERRIRDLPSMAAKRKVEPLYHAVYALLAALVHIAPDPAERFHAAARRGAEEMTEFDPLILTEYCAGRHEMPDARTAAKQITAMMGPEAGDLMRQIIADLLGPEEADVAAWLAEGLDEGLAAGQSLAGSA